MRLCSNCGHGNMEGEVFCANCGIALSTISVSTRQLADKDDSHSAGGIYLSDDHIIMLHFMNEFDPIALRIEDKLVLGRFGGEAEDAEVLNLDPFGALDQGVSRQHALLARRENQLFIRDLESTNHTFLNGEQLGERRDYSLHDGDEVRLGKLTIKIFFK